MFTVKSNPHVVIPEGFLFFEEVSHAEFGPCDECGCKLGSKRWVYGIKLNALDPVEQYSLCECCNDGADKWF